MDKTITLDERHFNAAVKRARELGTTPDAYVQTLIDQAGRTFDDILAPARKGFESLSDDDLEALFERAQKSARAST